MKKVKLYRRLGPVYRRSYYVMSPLINAAVRLRWSGAENLPETGGAVLASAHISAIDPIYVAYGVARFGRQAHFMAKASLFHKPVVKSLFKMWDFVPVDRKRGASSLEAAAEELRAGKILVIYPEGTFTRDPAFWPMTMKTGAARLALDAGVPLIPVAQWGAQDSMDRYSKRFSLRRTRTYAHILPAVDLSDLPGGSENHESVRIATERLQNAILQGAGQLRNQRPPTAVWDVEAKGPERAALAKLSKWRRQLARVNHTQDVLPVRPRRLD